ncbi:MAG: hypothetical protein ACI8ZM_001428 [Crocinitomix sp.]|jgi:hypothetical protein
MIDKKTKRGIITLLIYTFLLLAFFILNELFPGGRFAPDLGIFVFWLVLIYTPIALIANFNQYRQKDKSRIISLIIHVVVALIMLVILYRIDFRFF